MFLQCYYILSVKVGGDVIVVKKTPKEAKKSIKNLAETESLNQLSNSMPNVINTKTTINKLIKQNQPFPTILAHILTLPDTKARAEVCRQLAQNCWTQNTKSSKNISYEFEKLARQFERGESVLSKQ